MSDPRKGISATSTNGYPAMPTHADLVAAAEKARYRHTPLSDTAIARNGEVEVLLAILRVADEWGESIVAEQLVQIVADRLTGWGVL